MVTYSGLQQNVAGTNSNTGYFFGGFANGNLANVEVGWYAQGHDTDGLLVDGLVTAIDIINQRITIALPNEFTSGKSYIFTSEPLTTTISNTCFPSGTPIRTNKGIINIDKINPNIHTIRNKKIVAVTQSVSTDDYLVCFEKNSMGMHIPCEKTLISKNHVIFFKGTPTKAKKFVGIIPNVTKVKYNGEKLYNILLEEYDKMIVNNLIVETLHTNNFIAQVYKTVYNIYNVKQRNEIIIQLNEYIRNKKQLTK